MQDIIDYSTPKRTIYGVNAVDKIKEELQGLPFSIWVICGFCDTILEEIEEATWVDGSNKLNTLIRIVFPIISQL